jgi:predicted ribosome quality control (RQC) complex YloA/Tae2 family protein
MTFDGLTLAAMAVELHQTLVGARVQKVIQPEPLGVAIELYGNHQRSWLVLSADPQQPRVYVASEKPGRGVESPSPLLLLLRKRAEGARLADISQPPGERVLVFDFVGWPGEGAGPEGTLLFRLIIEAISQYSNLIMVDPTGLVLDAARRVSAEQNRTRVTLPRQPYVPPPAQKKRSLWNVSREACRSVLTEASPGSFIWQALVSGFAGLGPLAGREIAFRATGDTRARRPDGDVDELADHLWQATAEVVQPVYDGQFQSSVAYGAPAPGDEPNGERVRPVVAFAPYALRHLGDWQPRTTLSSAAEEFYRQSTSVSRLDLARRDLAKAVESERSQVERKRESLLRAMSAADRANDLRQRGELLLTYSSAIPRGAATFQAEGLSVELDPRLTAVENAQALFRRYRKAQAALREVPALLAETELRLRYLAEIDAWANLADRPDDVRALRSEVRPPRGQPTQTKARRRPRRPEDALLRWKSRSGAEIIVGRSAQQNQLVTFELGHGDDIWLHARGCPGAHVIARCPAGASLDAGTLQEAAQAAAYYSSNRSAARVTVDWTRRKHVRRLAKGVPGLVSYSGETSIVVEPQKPDRE